MSLIKVPQKSSVVSVENDWYQRAISYQNEFQKYYGQWKEFTALGNDLMKTMMGLMLYGPIEVPDNDLPLLNNYYKGYEQDKQENIDLIFNQLKNLPFNVNNPRIHLGLTLLFLRGNNDNDGLYFVFRTRDSTSHENLHFIDTCGRVYNGWEDFVNNNTLPNCEYLTVCGGVYGNNYGFQVYKSPAAKAGILHSVLNWGATITTFGCVAASVLAVAPVTTAVAGTTVGVYGAGQAVMQLRDRSKHQQSIGLDNKESILNYFNITASVIGGVTSVATANISKIQSMLGKYEIWASRVLLAGNCLTLALDGGFLLVNLRDINERFWRGDVTTRDVFNLALNIFLLYGAVINVQETYQALTTNPKTAATAGSIVNKKLTKTQKRNLQKRRAKVRKQQQQVAADTIVVSAESDFHTNVQMMATLGADLIFRYLFNTFPRSEIIYNTFLYIRSSYDDFARRRINIKTFSQNLIQHMINLYSIFKDDIQCMLNYLKQHFNNVPLNEDIAQLLNNEMDRINQDIDEIVENIDDKSDNTLLNSLALKNDTISFSYCKIITEAARAIVCRKNVDYSFDVILAFHHSLKFVTDELMRQFVQKYNMIVALNEKIEQIGVEKATKMANILGVKTEYDFYPNEERFKNSIAQIVSEKNTQQRDVFDEKIVIMVGYLRELIDKLFSNIIPANETIGLERTIKILPIISEMMVEQFSSYLEETKNQAKLIYEMNIEFFDEEIIKDMLQNIDLPIDDAEQFRCAGKKFEENEYKFVIKLLECCAVYFKSSKAESDAEMRDCSTSATNTYEDKMDATYNIHIFMSYCSQFFRQISTIDDRAENELELFKKVVHFAGKKFLEELSFYKNQDEWRTKNIELMGPKGFKEMMKILGLIEGEKSPLLNDISRKLSEDCDLTIAQYLSYYENNSPNLKNFRIWYDTIHDLGFEIILTECNKHESNDYYIERASYLFGIQMSDEISTVESYEDFIILKTENYLFTFSFCNYDDTDRKALITCCNLLDNIKE